MSFKKLLTIIGILVLALGVSVQPAEAIDVGTELALLIDVSGSVDASEYASQVNGYVSAFQSSAVADAIAASPTGSIAVTLIMWGGATQQQTMVTWTQVGAGGTSASDFADLIQTNTAVRPFTFVPNVSPLTAPGSAINDTYPDFFTNNFDGQKLVIDVSGDGIQNNGANTAAARDAALAAGIDQINGIAIGNETLRQWYIDNIKGGDGSFVFLVGDFGNSFAEGIENKILREIGQPVIPEPATMTLFGTGLLGMLGLRRRKK